MSYTDEETMRLTLAACAMAGLLRRRKSDGGDYVYTVHQYAEDRKQLAADSLAVADALIAEARKTPSP